MTSLDIGQFCRIPLRMHNGVLTVECVLTHIDVENRPGWLPFEAETEVILRFKAVSMGVACNEEAAAVVQDSLEANRQLRLTGDTEG